MSPAQFITSFMPQRPYKLLLPLARALSQPALLFYLLPWLTVLLVLGTVAQRYIGLYQSQKLFFGSFILWAGPLPLPGAFSVLAVIALSLAVKLFFFSPPRRDYAGILLAHASVLMLLAGAVVTNLCKEEGYLVLGDGERGDWISDYHLHELAVFKNDRVILTVPSTKLGAGADITGALPFTLHVVNYCTACSAVREELPPATRRGVARELDLRAVPLAKEEAENKSGVLLDIGGAGPSQDGTYLAFEPLAEHPAVKLGKDRYDIVMRPEQHRLPFALQLIHFAKEVYPGTDMAKSFRSDVRVEDAGFSWSTPIEMNQPLRYRGYTVYQSSFVEETGKVYTVLAVVRDAGEWFPYLSVIILCLGLLLHVVLRWRMQPL